MPSEALQALYQTHALASFGQQLALLPIIQEGQWAFDMQSGTLDFSTPEGSRAFPVQILGTEGYSAASWMWGWANTASAIPEPLLAAGRQLQQLGEALGVPELSQPSHPLEQADGHTIALVASGLLQAAGYYRCPYEGGALFVLLDDPSAHEPSDRLDLRLVRLLAEAAGALAPFDARAGLRGWATRHGADLDDRGEQLIITPPQGDPVQISLDAQGRITEISSRFTPR